MTFIETDITYAELTAWILKLYKRLKVTDLRYFGSRVHGRTTPRPDSDIDVYILFDGKDPGRGPIYSELYKHNGKNYVIEFHPMIDFHDGYVPNHLLNYDAPNELLTLK